MSGFFSFIFEAFSHPFCFLTIILLIWLWAKITLGEIDVKKYSMTYQECYQGKQLWRMLTAPFLHQHLFHLLINIMCIWNFRELEESYGSFYLLRYSILMLIFEALTALFAMNIIISRTDNILFTNMMQSHSLNGCSGVVLSWIAFQSIKFGINQSEKHIFYFFGFIPLNPVFAPIIMVVTMNLFVPRNHVITNLMGLLAGYLLSFGVLEVLPNIYWTICFFLNLSLIISYYLWFFDKSLIVFQQRYIGENNNLVIEIIQHPDFNPPYENTDSNSNPLFPPQLNHQSFIRDQEDDDLEAVNEFSALLSSSSPSSRSGWRIYDGERTGIEAV